MLRLYTSFARGAPGLGLILMRVVSAAALAVPAVEMFVPSAPLASLAFGVVLLTLGVLLLVGLWTPITGVTASIVACVLGFLHPAQLNAYLLLGTLAAALALLGPGAWSIDARLFGWKRVEIRNGNGDSNGQVRLGSDSRPG